MTTHEINVMELGAKSDNVTDDQPVLDLAVRKLLEAGAKTGTIYLPRGPRNYLLKRPVSLDYPTLNFKFVFEPGARLLGNFPDALIKRSVNSPIGGNHEIVSGQFENVHPEGKGVMMHSCVGAKITQSWFGVLGTAIETYNSQSITVDTCSVIGSQKIGIMAGNGTTVMNTDVTGCKEGLRHHNLGLVVTGGRWEMNNIAIRLGLNEKGEGFQSSGFEIQGLSMERNQTNIRIDGGSAGRIGGSAISSGEDYEYGIYIHSGENISIQGVSIGVSDAKLIKEAGVFINNGHRIVFDACRVQSARNPVKWRTPNPANTIWRGCDIVELTTKNGDATLDWSFHRNVRMNATNEHRLEIPNDQYFTGHAPPNGHIYTIIQAGSGRTTIRPRTGVTVRSRSGRYRTAGQWSKVFLEKIGPNEWLLDGDLAA